MKPYIESYIQFFYCVCTPLNGRFSTEICMPAEFKLKDMCDLHLLCALPKYGVMKPSIDGFIEAEAILRKYIISVLERIDFEHYPELENVLISFVEISMQYDSGLILLEESQKHRNDSTCAKQMSKLIEGHADIFYQNLLNGAKSIDNAMLPYVYLYEMMQQERKLIMQYDDQIEEILQD